MQGGPSVSGTGRLANLDLRSPHNHGLTAVVCRLGTAGFKMTRWLHLLSLACSFSAGDPAHPRPVVMAAGG